MSEVIIAEEISKKYFLGEQLNLSHFFEGAQQRISALFGEKKSNQHETNDFIWALKNINFSVKKGEIVGIIGGNGAGKSTLLKIFSRITEPTLGKVKLSGRVSSLLEVGTGFHRELTGRENIFLSGIILGMSKSEIQLKFNEIVAFAGLEKFIDTPVKRYSSGMYVRLAFSVAANLESEILLVDEVLAVGDIRFKNRCLGKIENFSKEGRTVLFVSHNLKAVQSMCNRVILLNEGSIEKNGAPAEVISYYINQGVVNKCGEKLWGDSKFAPGNDSVRLISVALKDENGNKRDKIQSCEKFWMHVKYQILKEDLYTLGVIVLNDEDTILFTTFDNLDEKRTGHKMLPGTYFSRCCFPNDFFKPGKIKFTIQIKTFSFSSKLHFREKDLLVLEVDDANTTLNNSFKDTLGVIRPILKWESSII